MKYFMHYLWRRPSFQTNWIPAMKATNEHPIDVFLRMQKLGSDRVHPTQEEFILVSWQVVNPDDVKAEEWWGNIG